MKRLQLNKKLILLDRDGVINQELGDYVCSPEQFQLYPNTIKALSTLKAHGFRLGLCTNQSGISKKRYTTATLDKIHQKMQQLLQTKNAQIDHIIYAPSSDDQDPKRKPNPGMLLEQSAYFQTSLEGVPFIGDSWTDICAARAAGAIPVLVQTGKGKRTLEAHQKELDDTLIYQNLWQMAQQWTN